MQKKDLLNAVSFSLKNPLKVALFLVMFFSQLSLVNAAEGEYYSTQRWRDLFSRYSPSINPAFMTEENYGSFRLGEGAFLENDFKFSDIGVTLPIGLYQSVGFSYLGELDPPVTGMIYSGDSMVLSGEKPSNSNHIFMASYAHNIWDRLSVGINASLSMRTNFDSMVTSPAVDLGLSYRLMTHPILGDHIIGASAQNIIYPLAFAKHSYSSNLKLSWNAYLWERQIDAGVDYTFKNMYSLLQKDEDNPVEPDLSARLGFWLFRVVNLYFQAGTDYRGFSGGVNFPHVNNGRDLSLVYQFLSYPKADNAISHTLFFRVQFGKHREEAYAERMAKFVDLAPSDLYNKACRLYYSGRYWDAYFVFSQIVAQYPTFFKNDWCQYYKGSCLEKLDMRDFAISNYEQAKTEYPKSSMIYYAEMGIMNINYRDDAAGLVSNQFSQLNKPDVSDSLKFHAYYLMAETYFKQKNYQQAKDLLLQIPETHPEYVFAQHSLGIVHIMTLNMDEAVNALGNCIDVKAENDVSKEIINRSYVLLGYIFYEQMALSKAVTAMRMVPKSSYYYNDAILGLTWTALRARQWSDCINIAQGLKNTNNPLPLQCDGALLEGYSQMMLKNYKQAFEILQVAQAKAQTLKVPSEDTLQTEKNKYVDNRKDYNELAKSMGKFSTELKSSIVAQHVDSLHKVQEVDKKKLDAFYVFSDEFTRAKFFTRNIDIIKNDLEYALAISQKISQQSTNAKTVDQAQDKQKEIDSEIEKLKREMEKLNSGGGK